MDNRRDPNPASNERCLEFPATTTVARMDASRFSIPLAQIGRYAGGSKYKMDTKTEGIARKALKRARALASPVFGYRLSAISRWDGPEIVMLNSGHPLDLPEEERDPALKGVAAVLCTLGDALDSEIRDQGNRGDLVFSLFLDAAGVALLEALSAACQEEIKDLARPMGLYCGCPFGPGYGTAPMGSFVDLFQHVDGDALGIRQAGDAMMEPLKSVAFWLRLTTDKASVKSQGYKCRRCSMENCMYRAAPYEKGKEG